ncbi:hypothetical protein P43SY_010010 [Pythium insidiosum]|uniref:Elicitor-like transglutaminase n=1 Tax=Pythium insidiosum TaxID=114742 RepID=A0AAD5L895_PYTIN|nr:hypothetical protein P43SY_010010 [Pythium insidiosum]
MSSDGSDAGWTMLVHNVTSAPPTPTPVPPTTRPHHTPRNTTTGMEDPFVNSGDSVFTVCGVILVVLGVVSIGFAVFLRHLPPGRAYFSFCLLDLKTGAMILPSQLLVVASLVAVSVTGSPLESNPHTLENAEVPLNHEHPGIGAQLPSNPATLTTPSDTEAHEIRPLEITSHDVQALENYFRRPMVKNADQLPRKGTFVPTPWPGSYWPTYEDGINARWDPSQYSPSEKYGFAFNLDVGSFTEKLSRNNGILAHSYRRKCTSNGDCAGLGDGSACAMRLGQTSGFCIPTWFGLCHAWAPAAILEPEPRCPVTKNGIKFEVMDIKALLTQIYDGANIPTVFTGTRYNGPDYGNDLVDQYGRYKNAAFRDVGPGFFHIATTNMLGLLNTTYVADVTAGSEVWNQPIRGYEILEQRPMTLEDGAKQFFNTATYPFNSAATKLIYVRMRLDWILESTQNGPHVPGLVDYYTRRHQYEYVLETDNANNILGGEWVGNAKRNHPDFMWFATRRPASNLVTWTGISYADVRALLDASVSGSC